MPRTFQIFAFLVLQDPFCGDTTTFYIILISWQKVQPNHCVSNVQFCQKGNEELKIINILKGLHPSFEADQA